MRHPLSYQPSEPQSSGTPVSGKLTLDSFLGKWAQRGQCSERKPEPADVSLLSKIKALHPWNLEGCCKVPGHPEEAQKGKGICRSHEEQGPN